MRDFKPKGVGYENNIFEKFMKSRLLGSREEAIRARSNSTKRDQSRQRSHSGKRNDTLPHSSNEQ